MNHCSDYYDKNQELEKDLEDAKELEEIRLEIKSLRDGLREGILKAYRHGFIDGYKLAAMSLED